MLLFKSKYSERRARKEGVEAYISANMSKVTERCTGEGWEESMFQMSSNQVLYRDEWQFEVHFRCYSLPSIQIEARHANEATVEQELVEIQIYQTDQHSSCSKK